MPGTAAILSRQPILTQVPETEKPGAADSRQQNLGDGDGEFPSGDADSRHCRAGADP